MWPLSFNFLRNLRTAFHSGRSNSWPVWTAEQAWACDHHSPYSLPHRFVQESAGTSQHSLVYERLSSRSTKIRSFFPWHDALKKIQFLDELVRNIVLFFYLQQNIEQEEGKYKRSFFKIALKKE